jgi:ADP-heptose:LPS heptosyltransferase
MIIFQSLERAGRELSSTILGKVLKVQKISLPDLRRALDRGEVRKILLVRNYQGMGDLLCASPVIAGLKSRFPGASIHFLANTFNQSALQNNPGLEKIWAWDEGRKADPRQWINFRNRLRQERFDLALVLSGNALSLTAILLAVLSGARWVAGYETKAYGQNWGSRLYSCEVPFMPVVREIDRYAGLLEGLGISCPNRFPEFFIRPDQIAFAEAFWNKHFSSKELSVVGVFLGGKVDRPDRIWPPENYARVARRLVEITGRALLVIAPPQPGSRPLHKRESTFWMDEAVHEQLFHRAYGEVFPVFRSPDLGRVAAVLRKLDLFICPDGGMMHLAAAIRVPTLTLFFGTSPEIWHPSVATSHYLRAPDNDPRALDPERVVQEAATLLKPLSADLWSPSNETH